MMTDPIADMLTRIRNACAVKKREICVPYSRIKFAIAQILLQAGYLRSAEKVRSALHDREELKIIPQYKEGNKAAITTLRRISKPGRRVYVGHQDLRASARARGLRIISTSRGVMTDQEAFQQKLGGEVLCEIN